MSIHLINRLQLAMYDDNNTGDTDIKTGTICRDGRPLLTDVMIACCAGDVPEQFPFHTAKGDLLMTFCWVPMFWTV
jgi:hypothetical protein